MLYLPQGIPVSEKLSSMPYNLNTWKEIQNCKRVLLLNLMPLKAQTELDIARTICKTDIDVQLIPIKIKGQTYKTTPMEHMMAFYLDFEVVEADWFDGLIITGAPVEQIPFEQVRYWTQLCHIMDWAKNNVERTLYICWGAQAGLYHSYGIKKYLLPEKRFGVFQQKVIRSSPLMKNLSPYFPMPNSRHTEVRREDIMPFSAEGLEIFAESEESGVGVVATIDRRSTFIVGHLEYEPYTLHHEYHRDLAKSLPIHMPEHYYKPDGTVDYVWQQAAIQFYTNWLNA